MITALIHLLIAALVLYIIFYVVGLFIQGVPLKIIGAILALVFLLYALRVFGFVGPFTDRRIDQHFNEPLHLVGAGPPTVLAEIKNTS